MGTEMKHKRALAAWVLFLLLLTGCGLLPVRLVAEGNGKKQVVKKVKDVVIYENDIYYSAFPSVIKTGDGKIMVAFRRAPDRGIFKESGTSHVDPNSYLVYVKSEGDGLKWPAEAELLYAHAFGGSQDPCLIKLSDGTLLCSGYGWAFVRESGLEKLRQPVSAHPGGAVFLGGYLLRSTDNGNTWSGPHYPPSVRGELRRNALGDSLPAYNRGALCEGRDGRIYWVVAACTDSSNLRKTSNHLLISEDKGNTWFYSCLVAEDEVASFNEASVYETPGGDLVAFMRTAGMEDQACIARSKDGGRSFGSWEKMGFRGHPLHAMRLPDERVFLVYGYRHPPYGIRARILNPECTDFHSAEEIVIRDDGGSRDIGYPWAVMLDEQRVFVAYYFNRNNGTRHIAGSILELK